MPFDNEARGFIYVVNSTVQLNDKQKLFGVVPVRQPAAGRQRRDAGRSVLQSAVWRRRVLGALNSTWSPRLNTRLQVSYNNKGQNDNLERIGGLSEHRCLP